MEGGQQICVVDAFTTERFRGNPAAVCILTAPAPGAWMQKVAGEMNLSETAFLVRRPDGGWDLRWFTPVTEVALCGHATLAAAHALWEEHRLDPDEPARFHTQSGWLTCGRCDGVIGMDFPARPAVAGEPPTGLAGALGADLRWCGASAYDWLLRCPTRPLFGVWSRISRSWHGCRYAG